MSSPPAVAVKKEKSKLPIILGVAILVVVVWTVSGVTIFVLLRRRRAAAEATLTQGRFRASILQLKLIQIHQHLIN